MALLLLAANVPLIPAFFDGSALYDICRRPNSGQCSMYVAGVIDGLFFARSRDGELAICPGPIDNREAAGIVLEHLERHPDARERAAAVGVREALAERMRCPPDRASTRAGDAPEAPER